MMRIRFSLIYGNKVTVTSIKGGVKIKGLFTLMFQVERTNCRRYRWQFIDDRTLRSWKMTNKLLCEKGTVTRIKLVGNWTISDLAIVQGAFVEQGVRLCH